MSEEKLISRTALLPTQKVQYYTHKGHPDQPPSFLPSNYFHIGGNYFQTEQALSCVSVALPQPTLFITLTVKAKYEHTYEYMNK